MHNVIPTDENIQSMGIRLASRCRNFEADIETIDHLLCKCVIAQEVWKFFGTRLSISLKFQSYRNLLMSWWRLMPNRDHQNFIFSNLPKIFKPL